MSYATIAGVIEAVLMTVDGTGQTHRYQRYYKEGDPKDPYLYKDAEGDPETVRTWMISRSAVTEDQATGMSSEIHHTMTMRGYLAVQDGRETEVEFQAIIDAVMAAFRPQDRLAVKPVVEVHFPAQAEEIGYAMLAGVLCHYAELTMELLEYKTT